MNRFHLGNQNLRQILALTLACLMIFTSLPASAFRAFAEDEQTEGEAIVETFEETEDGGEDPAPEVPEGDLEEGEDAGGDLVVTGDGQDPAPADGEDPAVTGTDEEDSEAGGGSVVGQLADEIGNILNKDDESDAPEELQEAEEPPRAVRSTRDITVSIAWEGDIPVDFTYPDAVELTVESSADEEAWEPVEGSFTVEPDDWTATFSLPAADETDAPLSYRIMEKRDGLERFLCNPASVTIGPDDSGDVTFTNTYNDGWDYTVDLYWDRSGEERYHINSETITGSTDLVVYKLDILTQQQYEGIPTTVSDEELLNPTSGLVIRIPLHFFKDRNGNWVDPIRHSIHDDTAPTTDREFTYRIIGDEIVFYNYRTLPSSYLASYTVAYNVDPENTLDGSSTTLWADAVGHYPGQPADDDGHQSTDPITYRIDTGSYIVDLVKDNGKSLYYAVGSLEGMPMDDDSYYLYYIVRVRAEGNQPANITITDTPMYYDQNSGQVVKGGEVVKIVKWKFVYNKQTAPVGEYPDGDNVEFTTNEDGSVSWVAYYDAVTANIEAAYNTTPYWNAIKAKAEQDFFVVVRYPKSTYNFISGPAPNYQNIVKADLEVIDPQKPGDVRPDPQNGITGNDFNDTDFKTASAYAEYIPHGGWSWGGGRYAVSKTSVNNNFGSASGPSWIYGVNVGGSFHVTMTGDGYDLTDIGRGYSMTLWDDDFYVRPVYKNEDGTTAYGPYTKLGPGDYEMTYGTGNGYTPEIRVEAWHVNRDNGVHLMDASMLPEGTFKLLGERADGTWELIDSFSMTEDNTTFTSTSEGNQAQFSFPLTGAMFDGKGYIGLKIESPEDLVDHVMIKIFFRVRLLGTSPTLARWKEEYGDNLKTGQTINFATFRFYAEDASGDYVWSNPQSGPTAQYSGDTTGLAESEKTEDGQYELYASRYNGLDDTSWRLKQEKQVAESQNDTTMRVYRHRWYLSVNQYMPFQSSNIPASLKALHADNGVFYDLLPVGYTIDLTRPITVQGTNHSSGKYAALDGDPIIIDNYKNTGRQLVIFKVKSLIQPGENYHHTQGMTYTGWRLYFWSQVAYADIANQTVYNIYAYQRGDRMTHGFSYPNSRGYGSSSTGFLVDGIYPLADVEREVFGNSSEGNTTGYASVGVDPAILPSIQAGLFKSVRGVSGVWSGEDVTDVDANYAYRLRLQTAGDSDIKYYTGDIVIYDTLENAANTDGHTGEVDGWKGTLVSVDTSAVARQGASPVVYYTTKADISYNNSSSVEWEDSLANKPGIWIRADEYAGDLAAVTAIAIDMRYQADGTTPFVVEDEKSLDIIVNMHAPGTVPESQYAYNRPAFQAKTWTEMSPEAPVPGFEIGSRTVLALRDLQDIEFIKYYNMFNSSAGTSVQNPLAGATFNLYKCINPDGNYLGVGMPGTTAAASCWDTTPLSTLITSSNGKVSFRGLDSGIYAICETAGPSVPVGIQRLTNRFWYFEVDSVAGTITTPVCQTTANNVSPVEFTTGENNMLMLEDPIYTVDVSVEKIWKDGGNADGDRPESIRVQLMRNDEAYGPVVTLNADNNWSYTWTRLQKYSAYTSASNNTPYSYTVVEVDTPAGYISTTSGTMANGFKITNTKVVEFSGIKVWDHNINPEEDRPTSAEILLKRNGTQIDSVMATEETDWAWSFTNLPKYDDNGDAYTYEVDETAIPDYDTTIVQNPDGTYTITNVYAPSGDLKVTKTVATASPGSPNQTFDFTVTLTKDNAAVTGTYETVLSTAGSTEDVPGTLTFDAEGKATFTLQGGQSLLIKALPKSASYTVEETTPVGWGASYEGQTGTIAAGGVSEAVVTNTYNASCSTQIEGEKTLNGRALKAGEFEFALYAVDAQTGEETMIGQPVSNDADGKFSFPPISYGLSDHGKTYTYVVRELRPVIAVENGITYTTDYFTVEVAVSDNGNGTMTATKTIKKNGQEPAETIEFVNTYNATGETQFGGRKVLEGRDLEAGEFEFALFAADGTQIGSSVANDADGNFTLPKLTYTLEDVPNSPFTYTVKEVAGSLGGVTYATTTYTVTVTVADGGNGSLIVTHDAADRLVFTNTYSATGETQFDGRKVLEGGQLAAGEFEFALFAADGTQIGSNVANDAEGKFTLPKLTYTLEDVPNSPFTYTVKEVKGNLGGVEYDDTTYTVTVTVSDPNHNGQLVVTHDAGVRLVFTNTYSATGNTQFGGTKVLEGRDLAAGEFSFELYEGEDATGEPLQTVSNNATGAFLFEPLTYTHNAAHSDIGTHTYTVKEVAGNLGGVTYSTATYKVTVTVSDPNHNGELVVTNDAADRLVFTNTYIGEGNTRFGGRKVLNGRDLAAGEFSFALYAGEDTTGEPLQTVSNNADGTFLFDPLTYAHSAAHSDLGTHTYTVKEVAGNLGGVDYDETTYKVTVTVSDPNGNGELLVTNDAGVRLVFTNTYSATGKTQFGGTKTLTGRTLAAGEFSFALYEGEDTTGEPLQTVSNNVNGAFLFEPLTYSHNATHSDIGTHTYTVKEVAGDLGGVDYDETTYKVTVTVSDPNHNGELVVTNDAADRLSFTNDYAAMGHINLSGVKTVTGRDLAANEFTFKLYEGTDTTGTPLQTKTNAADGSITFDQINYILNKDHSDLGEHTYTVVEAVGSLTGIVYDETVYTITVTVTDNLDGNLNVATTVTPDATATTLNFTNPYVTTSIDGVKTWDDDFDRDGIRPLSITVNLLQNGSVYDTTTVTEADDWSYSWSGLPKYEPGATTNNKTAYNYTVEEAAIVWDENVTDHGYTATYTGNDIKNTHAPELIDIPVTKIWDDYNNRYNTRPETITVNLLADDVVIKTVVLSLPRPEELIPAEETFRGIKADDNEPGETPAVELIYATAKLDEDGNWYYVFEDLYKYRDHGTPIVYTITEEPVQYYTTTIEGTQEDGFVITNKYRKTTPPPNPEGSITFKATKVLTGRDLAAGEFFFELYEGDKLLQTKTNAANGAVLFDTINYTKDDVGVHTYTISEVEGSDPDITYDLSVYTITVTVAINGKVMTVTADGAEGIVFENTYEEEDNPPPPFSPYEEEPEIEEPELPHSPYTGDDRHTAYWLLLSMLSAAGIVILGRKRREEE